jgi:hypothetical protein
MANSFEVNRKVALAYVKAEQMKGWFLAQARYLVIFLSGMMLFLGVVLLFGHLQFGLTLQFAVQLLAVAPIALVAGLLAVIIQGGTVFTSAVYSEAKQKEQRALDQLQRVSHKFKAEEIATRGKQIRGQSAGAFGLMLVFVLFDCLGAEIFWQEIMGDQAWYFHVIGGVLGLVCSSLLILLELKADVVERIIERSIASSAMIFLANREAGKGQIMEASYQHQKEFLGSAETYDAIGAANTKFLHGILAETVSMSGMSVTAEQLQRELKKSREERAAATAYLATGDDTKLLSAPMGQNEPQIEIKRKSRSRAKVEKAVGKYGLSRMAEDVDKYAEELGMDGRTLKRHLEDIANNVA